MINSISYSQPVNFRVLVTDGANPITGVQVNITNVETYSFTTDAGGFTNWIYIRNLTSTTTNIFIEATDVRAGFNQSEILTEGVYEIQLLGLANFSISPSLPVRLIEENNSGGIKNTLFCDLKMGSELQISTNQYFNPRLTSITEQIQIKTSTELNFLVIKDYFTDTEVSRVQMTNIQGSYYEGSVLWGEGNYYYEIELGTISGVLNTLRSEPIEAQANFPNHKLIEYTSTKDRDFIVFDKENPPTFYILVQADLIPTDDDGEVNINLTDIGTGVITSDEVSDLYLLSSSKEVPFYIKKKVQIALGHDSRTINGENYFKVDQGSSETFDTRSYYQNFEIVVRREEFNSNNFY